MRKTRKAIKPYMRTIAMMTVGAVTALTAMTCFQQPVGVVRVAGAAGQQELGLKAAQTTMQLHRRPNESVQETTATAESGEQTKPLKEEYSITEAQLSLIYRVVAAEARGEGYEGQLAVAQVIQDRSDLWAMTPEEVVRQPGQFAKPYLGEISEETSKAVEACFLEGKRVFSQSVTHFCESSITPYWARGKSFAGRIGNHNFYGIGKGAE